MAISDYTITDAQINAAHVAAQPTVLQGTAAQNKAVFDNYPELIKDHFNGLITELSNGIDTAVDPAVLALYASLGWVQD